MKLLTLNKIRKAINDLTKKYPDVHTPTISSDKWQRDYEREIENQHLQESENKRIRSAIHRLAIDEADLIERHRKFKEESEGLEDGYKAHQIANKYNIRMEIRNPLDFGISIYSQEVFEKEFGKDFDYIKEIRKEAIKMIDD